MKNRIKGDTEVRREGEGLGRTCRSGGSRALGRELRFRAHRDPEQRWCGEKEAGRRWEEVSSGGLL